MNLTSNGVRTNELQYCNVFFKFVIKCDMMLHMKCCIVPCQWESRGMKTVDHTQRLRAVAEW